MNVSITEQFNKIQQELYILYGGRGLDDDEIKELYYLMLMKLKDNGWEVSEETEADPSSMIIVRTPHSPSWSLLYVGGLFNISNADKIARDEFSYSLMDTMWGC